MAKQKMVVHYLAIHPKTKEDAEYLLKFESYEGEEMSAFMLRVKRICTNMRDYTNQKGRLFNEEDNSKWGQDFGEARKR